MGGVRMCIVRTWKGTCDHAVEVLSLPEPKIRRINTALVSSSPRNTSRATTSDPTRIL